MTLIFIYDLLIGGINVSDFHIVVFFNDYYTLIVAFLMKQIQNRYRYRRVATPHFMQPLGKFGKIVCWRLPWRVGTPTSGKSWIRH